jgi:hypothetical protein
MFGRPTANSRHPIASAQEGLEIQKEHATQGVACSLGVVSIWPPSEDSRTSDVQLAANESAKAEQTGAEQQKRRRFGSRGRYDRDVQAVYRAAPC